MFYLEGQNSLYFIIPDNQTAHHFGVPKKTNLKNFPVPQKHEHLSVAVKRYLSDEFEK